MLSIINPPIEIFEFGPDFWEEKKKLWQVVQWDLVLLLKKLTFRETWKWKSPKWKRTAERRLYYIITVWLVYQQLCLNGSKACFSLSVVYCGYCITMLLYSLPRRLFFFSRIIIMGSSRLPRYIPMIPSPFAEVSDTQILLICPKTIDTQK